MAMHQALLLLLLAVGTASALNNGLARKPPMGWMSWEIFRCHVDCAKEPDSCVGERLYKQIADEMVSGGYLDAGYVTLSIDDCWEQKTPPRTDGKLVPNATRFPSGMKALGDYFHSKGVHFGLYSAEGAHTCGGYPGSLNNESVDASTFAEWGVDYLKEDGCGSVANYEDGYARMGQALNATGRPIVYSCSWPAYLGANETAKPFQKMIDDGCNLWRNYRDIQDNWGSLSGIIDHWGNFSKFFQQWAAPGHWHDPDMLLIGTPGISTVEAQTQMAIWSISAAPLIMGNDLRNISAEAKAILLNKEVIAVDQDEKGKMGARVSEYGPQEVWARELVDGVAVVLLNKGEAAATIKADFSAVGFGSTAHVRDLYQQKDLGQFDGSYSASVAAHGVVLVKLTA